MTAAPKVSVHGRQILKWMKTDIFPLVQNRTIQSRQQFKSHVMTKLPAGFEVAEVDKMMDLVFAGGSLGKKTSLPTIPRNVDDVQLLGLIEPIRAPKLPGIEARLPVITSFAGLRLLDADGKSTVMEEEIAVEEEEAEEETAVEEMAEEDEYDYELVDTAELEEFVPITQRKRGVNPKKQRNAITVTAAEEEDMEIIEEEYIPEEDEDEIQVVHDLEQEDLYNGKYKKRMDATLQLINSMGHKEFDKLTPEQKLEALHNAERTAGEIEDGHHGEAPVECGAYTEQFEGPEFEDPAYLEMMRGIEAAQLKAFGKKNLTKKEKKKLKNLEQQAEARKKKVRKMAELKSELRVNLSKNQRTKKPAQNEVFMREAASRSRAVSMKMEDIDNWRELSTQGLCVPRMVPSISDQGFLIGNQVLSKGIDRSHKISNAPLLTDDVIISANDGVVPKVPQFGLIGTTTVDGEYKRLFTNANVPLSSFICGLQGSGKSHTLSCMLENFMVPEPKLGCLQKPLPALVFQFSPHTHSAFKPCEAGFLGKPPLPGENLPTTVKTVRSVRILVSSSNYANMKKAYESIPEASVSALRFRPKDLTIGSMLQLMAVGSTQSSQTPLYMHRVTQILRDMATMNNGKFDYEEFKYQLGKAGFQKDQSNMLRMRLDLLESFLGDDETSSQFSVEPGVLTLVDLSCPFVDPETACALFSISLDFYLTASGDQGRNRGLVVALDEAHKYITSSTAAQKFTDSLLALIRQQRHYGARVLISTQEPTVSPRLLDLCSMTVCHRFTSPEWFRVLRRHVNVADEDREQVFNRILDLNVGQALVFAPTAVVKPPKADDGSIDGVIEDSQRLDVEEMAYEDSVDKHEEDDDTIGGRKHPGRKNKRKLNAAEMEEKGIFEMYVRKRITFDGGRSIVSMDTPNATDKALEDIQSQEANFDMPPEEHHDLEAEEGIEYANDEGEEGIEYANDEDIEGAGMYDSVSSFELGEVDEPQAQEAGAR